MHQSWFAVRVATVLAALLAAGTLTALTPATASASASKCAPATGAEPADPGSTSNSLAGVVTLSPCNAWIVGSYASGGASHTLIEHWDGSRWTQQSSPSPAAGAGLSAVAATSYGNAWAVGDVGGNATLTEHWNGKRWHEVPSPNRAGQECVLSAVTAVSKRAAWAVGTCDSTYPIIEHWNGKKWHISRRPRGLSGRSVVLSGVAATSAANAWAVGQKAPQFGTVIYHWNGKTWKLVPSPNPVADGDRASLAAVSATSARNAWAVGSDGDPTSGTGTFVEHWNGRSWKIVASPSPGIDNNLLTGVTAISARNAWAVGWSGDNPTGMGLFLEHWNGKRWHLVAAPGSFSSVSSVLSGISGSSATDIWAVGDNDGSNIALHLR